MAIDDTFLERINDFGSAHGIFPGGHVAILGDCRFWTSWASGNNRRDLNEFQRRYGLERVETLDIGGDPTIRLDLHAPVPDTMRGQFDMVVDAGTMHCCFDVARVLENILGLLKEKGAVLHVSAFVGFTGRCYYKIDPSLFQDFYAQNGFAEVRTWVKVGAPHGFLHRMRRKLSRLAGSQVGSAQPVYRDAMQVGGANELGFRFSRRPKGFPPAMLPNDSVVLCGAWREATHPYIRPIPSFFTNEGQ